MKHITYKYSLQAVTDATAINYRQIDRLIFTSYFLSLYINPAYFRQQDIVVNLNSSFIILINSYFFFGLSAK